MLGLLALQFLYSYQMDREAAVECAPRLRRKALNQTLFNKLNQAIRVGACEYGLIVKKIISITSGHARNHIVI